MGAAAAGKLLEPDRLGLHLPPLGLVSISHGWPQFSNSFVTSNVPGPLKTFKKPCACSKASVAASKPPSASRAASRPLRQHWPICSGLVMVPKFAFRPLASDAAIHSAIVFFE